MVVKRPRAGIVRSARPARPPAATRVVARTSTGWATRDEPAVAVGATNGIQSDVPRSTSVSDIHWVVTPEDSMKSRNGGLMRPSSISGTSHHVTARAEVSSHHPVKRRQTGLGRWQAHQITAGRQAAKLATALTAPISASAMPARAARTRSGTRVVEPSARITGSSTQGASIIGSVSDEIDPSVVSTRGDNANAAAATSRVGRLPIPSASATRTRPQKPAVSNNAHHSRWIAQPGMPSACPARKNPPCGNR